MSTLKSLISTLVAGIAAFGSGLAAAAPAESYVGANLGLYNKYSLDCKDGVKCDKTGKISGKVYAGVNYDQFGVEAIAFGINKGEGSVKQAGKDVAGTIKLGGIGAVGVLRLSNNDWTLKGKLGLAYVRGQASYAAGGSESKSSAQPLLGAGVSYALNQNVSLNADWDHVRAKYDKAGSKTNVNMLSLGVSYKF